MTAMTGRCLCGAVTYALANLPARVTLCSCKFCQRVTGAGQAILAIAPAADLTVTRGRMRSFTHISEGSGKALYLHFCETCGTQLYMSYERWPDMVGLFTGTLDDPAAAALDPASSKQIFLSSARPDTVVLAGIPAFWDHAAGPDGSPVAPLVLDAPTAVGDLRQR